MMLLLIVGVAKYTKTPPPIYRELGVEVPCCRVKPLSVELDVSFVANVTTGATPPPSTIVRLAPFELFTVIALPMKLMFSVYVPGATNTVSPLLATLIPA
jgi:hypothetical protein